MAGTAFARMLTESVTESVTEVRYAFGATPEADEGVLVVPVADPDAWYVEGTHERPVTAQWALLAVLRRHRREGRWPAQAAFHS